MFTPFSYCCALLVAGGGQHRAGVQRIGFSVALSLHIHFVVRSSPQVVDSTDRGRVAIARGELTLLLGHEHLEAVPVLVIANKQDLRDAMTPGELSAALCLPDVKVTFPSNLTHSHWLKPTVQLGCLWSVA